MKKYVIIVAGGSGTRFKHVVPKQFLEVDGLPIIMHTMVKFYKYEQQISLIVVLPDGREKEWLTLVEKKSFDVPHEITIGGENRFYSVRNGLKLVKEKGLVAVHDGVRPLVNLQTIKNCFDSAEIHGAAIPVVPVHESLRLISENGSKPVDRDLYRLVQTPQVAHSGLFKKAYEMDYQSKFTDDASVLEHLGVKIQLVPGNMENIKITTPIDLEVVRLFITGH